jgi:predicted dinucleotide-binding enzyme
LESDIVIPFMLYQDLIPWLKKYKEKLKGKVLIDIHIPFNDTIDDLITDYNTSASEEIQKLLPNTRVIGALKNLFLNAYGKSIENVDHVYVAGDDGEAKKIFIEIFQRLPFRIIDAGHLKNNRTIERMILIIVNEKFGMNGIKKDHDINNSSYLGGFKSCVC